MGTRYIFMFDNSPVYNEGNGRIIIHSGQYSHQGEGKGQGKILILSSTILKIDQVILNKSYEVNTIVRMHIDFELQLDVYCF